MRKYTILSVILSLFLIIGCGKDTIVYDNGMSSEDESEFGYLVFSDAIYVDLASEVFIESKSSDSDLIEASDDYIVTITNTKSDEVVYYDTYGALKKLEELALTPSSYSILVQSAEDVPNIGDEPYYVGQEDVVVASGLETVVDNISCVMGNIKVSLTLSADLLDLFKEDGSVTEENLNVVISIGDNSIDYGRAESGNIVYFKALESSNTLNLELTGMYNTAADNEDPTYTMIEGWKESIEGVKAGQWRNITLSILHSKEGTIDFSVTIETWSYDDTIDVDITSSSFIFNTIVEPELDDPENYISDVDSPVVTLGESGGSLDQIFYVDQNSFGLNSALQAVCNNPLIFSVETVDETSISEMWIEYKTDSDALNSLLESSLGAKMRDYILPTTESTGAYTISGNLFTATYELMYKLYMYSGTHDLTIMVKDAMGRSSYSYLTVVSSNEGVDIPATSAPTIEWVGDYDFEERYVVDPVDGLDIVINIASESGITGFTVEINSEVLTQDVLEGINLTSNLDLINPGDYEEGLALLGFPTGDAVKNQTYLVFDITSFMPMLMTQGAGDSDFVLNITDAGGTTSKTVRVRVE